jgi:two-component system response regulator AtoC
MKILVVDDEPGLRSVLSTILREEGHELSTASDGVAALEALEKESVDLILCDVRMPRLDGLSFLTKYRESDGRAIVIMMSAYLDDEAALEAMRRGAYDYIPKPFRADQVVLIVRKAIERERLRSEVQRLRDELQIVRGSDEIIGRSDEMRELQALAQKAARHPTTVLITGESGTGKELIARLVHRQSPRAERPFVAVNCGAIPEALLESELFGHVKGAFTGATGARSGLFEEADGGTILLDEIGELPGALQVKLLRAIQEGKIRRVGDNTERAVDVRIIAATSRDLEVEVAENRFRSDLFYRLNVVRLHLPPLRERRQDIADIAKHFVAMYAARLGLGVRSISQAAIRALMEYDWPGNVRELENVIERGLVSVDGEELDAEHVAQILARPASSVTQPAGDEDLSVKRRTAALEEALIRRALEQTGGNRTRAARLLDLSHRALLYKIREYGLQS